MALSFDIAVDRFQGCLLGLAVGDALGGRFEAQSPEAIRARFPTPEALVAYPQDEIWYTDDTQMAIGVAEALVARGEIVEEVLCAAFVANYVRSRGYGRGARAVLEAMEDGQDHRAVAERYHPGGSYGNGAAMRVAPVGLLFGDDLGTVDVQAERSALPTHRHPLGIEGALGNGIEALESVPAALASFALHSGSYADTIGHVILLGGDTDTLAAMAGAVSGAYLGTGGLPARLVGLLETGPKGRDYLSELARRLAEAYQLRAT